ncbi:MAG: DUF6273 domain-containing protein [Coriobacteriia bacterium]|nr:DUF6273 domain-containing protein [Coriobacteriia bacterium]
MPVRSRSRGGILLLCVAILFIIGCSSAYAVDRGDLTSYIRDLQPDGLLEIGDVVTFGVLPANTGVDFSEGVKTDYLPVPATFTPGTPIRWIVIDVDDVDDPSELILAIAPEYDLGYRPINGYSGPFPLLISYRQWADSEICAWLNSSRAANGVDYSLASGGVSGYGFLETAFSKLQQATLMPFGAVEGVPNSTVGYHVDQKVVLPSHAESMEHLLIDEEYSTYPADRIWALRHPGDDKLYSLWSMSNISPSTVSSTQYDRNIAIRPVVHIDLEAGVFDTTRALPEEFIVYEQPQSAVYALGDVPADLMVAIAPSTLFDYAVTSMDWYTLGEKGPQIVASGTLALTPSTTVAGRHIYWLEMTVNGQLIKTTEAIVSVCSPQAPKLPCSDCHTNNVRKLHTESNCTLCHAQVGAGEMNWTAGRPENGFADFTISCGLTEDGCHGAYSFQPWHTEEILEKHDVFNEIEVGDPQSGLAKTISFQTAVVSNSCGGNPFDLSCHAYSSIVSGFYFGNMNLMTAHNDYAKAQKLGMARVVSAELGSAGCSACHSKDQARPLADEKDFNCSTCHTGGAYFAGSVETSRCLEPDFTKPFLTMEERIAAKGGVVPVKAPAAPTEVSLGIQKLVGGLLGIAPEGEPLKAGVTELPAPELPSGFFPVGSLLDGTGILSPNE